MNGLIMKLKILTYSTVRWEKKLDTLLKGLEFDKKVSLLSENYPCLDIR